MCQVDDSASCLVRRFYGACQRGIINTVEGGHVIACFHIELVVMGNLHDHLGKRLGLFRLGTGYGRLEIVCTGHGLQPSVTNRLP